MRNHPAVEHMGRGLALLLAATATTVRLNAQSKPGNAVAMVGAGAAMGAGGYMLGVLVARLNAADQVDKPTVRRWPFVAATFPGSSLRVALPMPQPVWRGPRTRAFDLRILSVTF